MPNSGGGPGGGAYVGAGGMAGADFRLGAVGLSLVSAFAEAGAEIAPDAKAALDAANIVLKVLAPLAAGEGEADEA